AGSGDARSRPSCLTRSVSDAGHHAALVRPGGCRLATAVIRIALRPGRFRGRPQVGEELRPDHPVALPAVVVAYRAVPSRDPDVALRGHEPGGVHRFHLDRPAHDGPGHLVTTAGRDAGSGEVSGLSSS